MDICRAFLLDKKDTTQRIYKTKLKMFFKFADCSWHDLLALDQQQAIALVLTYKNYLKRKGLAPATVNNHLAAVKSFVAYGNKVGACNYILSDIKGMKVETYRDTAGVSPDKFKQILSLPDRSTLKGKRDYALLRLLWENALRRDEVSSCYLVDYLREENILWIHGKGRGQKEAIKISDRVIEVIDIWLDARSSARIETKYLFCSLHLDPKIRGDRFTGDGIYSLVRNYGHLAGITKIISPHRIRHSSITAVLDATGGDVRKTQQLSRHKSIDTLIHYDDNRKKYQEEVTNILSDLI